MKYILASLALAAITLSTPNRSNAQVYIDISGGVSLLNDFEGTVTVPTYYGSVSGDFTLEFDNGEAFNFEIGKKTDNRTFGLLVGHASNDVSKISDDYYSAPLSGEVTSIPVLGVFGFAAPISDNLSFNFGLGAGVNFLDVEDDDDMVFQFQVKAGLELLLTENVSLGLDYRFSANTSPEYEEAFYYGTATIEGDMLLGHFIGVGLNITF
jgi:opacity protein-like surface antigen